MTRRGASNLGIYIDKNCINQLEQDIKSKKIHVERLDNFKILSKTNRSLLIQYLTTNYYFAFLNPSNINIGNISLTSTGLLNSSKALIFLHYNGADPGKYSSLVYSRKNQLQAVTVMYGKCVGEREISKDNLDNLVLKEVL